MSNELLHVDIDHTALEDLRRDLGGTAKQVQLAFRRACTRTAAKLQKLATKALVSELEIEQLKKFRRRLLSFRMKKTGEGGMKLWYGLNDLPPSWLTGKPTKTTNGVQFRDKQYPGAFMSHSGLIYKRQGKSRYPIETLNYPFQEKAERIIEREVFAKVTTIFWAEFERDLKARINYNIGAK
jgi:hypothetical protein